MKDKFSLKYIYTGFTPEAYTIDNVYGQIKYFGFTIIINLFLLPFFLAEIPSEALMPGLLFFGFSDLSLFLGNVFLLHRLKKSPNVKFGGWMYFSRAMVIISTLELVWGVFVREPHALISVLVIYEAMVALYFVLYFIGFYSSWNDVQIGKNRGLAIILVVVVLFTIGLILASELFHNTLFQKISSIGIVGIFGMLFPFIETVRIKATNTQKPSKASSALKNLKKKEN
jgi:hypothetical protein